MRLNSSSKPCLAFIIETLLGAENDSITLVPTGPLTNIGEAMSRQPDILPKIREIVLMGGAMREGGNTTPSAEFNILEDPDAAQIVMECGRPLTIVPLDVTHQALVSQIRIEQIRALDTPVGKCGRPLTIVPLDVTHQALVSQIRIEQIRALDTPVGTAVVGMMEFFNRFDSEKYGSDGAPLHDPCTIAYLLKPELFKGKMCNVEIETGSPLTRGHTAVDFWGVTDKTQNANWLYKLDADGFFALLIDRLNS